MRLGTDVLDAIARLVYFLRPVKYNLSSARLELQGLVRLGNAPSGCADTHKASKVPA
jgi:hypothetical protein